MKPKELKDSQVQSFNVNTVENGYLMNVFFKPAGEQFPGSYRGAIDANYVFIKWEDLVVFLKDLPDLPAPKQGDLTGVTYPISAINEPL
jgi:hypothetical protein